MTDDIHVAVFGSTEQANGKKSMGSDISVNYNELEYVVQIKANDLQVRKEISLWN